MTSTLSPTSAQIEQASGLLAAPVERAANPWAGLGAAAFAAVSAVLMAGVMVLGPGITLEDRRPVEAIWPAG